VEKNRRNNGIKSILYGEVVEKNEAKEKRTKRVLGKQKVGVSNTAVGGNVRTKIGVGKV